jgi:hypothetical protein
MRESSTQSMMSWDYLPLILAAKELGCTEDYFKHLAANRNARIHVLTGGRASWETFLFDEHDRLVKFRQALPNICLVPFEFWARWEAGDDCQLNSLTSVDSKNMPDGIGDVLYSAPWKDCTGKTIEFTKFVILRDELERLKQTTRIGPTQGGIKENNCASQENESKPWLIADPKDPDTKQPWYTPARYFARQLVKDDSTLLVKRNILAEKVARSLYVAGFTNRSKKQYDPGTVLKAFSNVSFS